MYDIVFISYKESNAEQNWRQLQNRMPHAKRLHGITGLHAAHAVAASMVSTSMFYVVDGDAVVEESFNFDYSVAANKAECVHVFRAKNPVNNLVYGYGAIKLLPTADVLKVSSASMKPDVTTSINRKYEIVNIVSNITKFDTDPFNTWRSAFRECAKLSSKIIPEQRNLETEHRLNIWCSFNNNAPYGKWCIHGANAGKEYGITYRDNNAALMLINDMSHLKQLFDRCEASI